MKINYINTTPGYSNLVVVTTGNIQTVHVAGQVGSGETMEAQIRSSYLRLINQLETINVKFSDIVKITMYVVDYKEEYLPLFKKIRIELFGEQVMPAITMLGVSALAMNSIKVEMEAMAMAMVEVKD